MKPIVIIPAYNPDEKLIDLVVKLQNMDMQIIVVNDGSKTECRYIFEALKDNFVCEICTHEKNMGKGAALKTGIRYAAKNYPESCGYVTADADGQHAAKDIFRVADSLEKHPASFVLGTRDFHDKNIPFKSRWGNRITSFVFLLTSGKKCADTQTGLRGIPSEFLNNCLSIPGNNYEYEMNTLLKIAHDGRQFISVPIETIYLDDNKSSHFNPVKDSVRIYTNIVRYSFNLKTHKIH